ncbi:MAG TPA: M20 family metallopeptidase [Streptosporangiaceae bacterium]|jgi:hippurate hydrolase
MIDTSPAQALRREASALAGKVTALRHGLHQRPEVGLDLPETQRAVLAALAGLGLELRAGRSCGSVTAVLRGTGPRGGQPPVLLRADMDALPVQEPAGLPWASTVPGVMHACGHDLHTAMLAGAAELLSHDTSRLGGDVIFMFQPGEEGYEGAREMIADGILDAAGERAGSAFGIHVISGLLPRGMFSARPGTMMAAADGLSVTVHGRGGHGSAPHRAGDPIPVAAEMIIALQTMVTRQSDIFDPVVITAGTFHAGTRGNVIPDDATFEATVRTYSPKARARVQQSALRLCESIAAAHGLRAQARWIAGYPPTVNDDAQYAFAAEVVTSVFGAGRFERKPVPDTGAEDFSRVLAEVPGCFVFLGASASDDFAAQDGNHSPRASFDDSVMTDGVVLLAELAIRRLARNG